MLCGDALSRTLLPTLGHRVGCTCREYVFHEVVIAPAIGLWPLVRTCPRCRKQHLLLYRITHGRSLEVKFLGIHWIPGSIPGGRAPTEAQLRAALSLYKPQVNDDDIEFAVTVARLGSQLPRADEDFRSDSDR